MGEDEREQRTKYEPSHEWTPEDRLEVALDILDEMRTRAKAGVGGASSEELRTWADRTTFVLNKPPRFLEDNRKQILDGPPEPQPSK